MSSLDRPSACGDGARSRADLGLDSYGSGQSRSRHLRKLRVLRAPGRNDPDIQLGLLETILVIDGVGLEAEAHLDRLEHSVAILYGRALPASVRLEAQVAAQRSSGVRRLRLSAWPEGDRHIAWDMKVQPVAQHVFRSPLGPGMRLVLAHVSGGLGAHKWKDRHLLEELACQRGLAHGEEVLVVDDNTEVLEAGMGNLFAMVSGTIVTPAVDKRMLAGVTRARVLDLMAGRGIPTRVGPLTIDALRDAEEIFLTSAIRGIEPVGSCDDIGSWPAGEVTLMLRRELAELWSQKAVSKGRR